MNAPELRLSRITEGLPYPLGASWDGKGVNFALATAHATKVEVCLFDKDGKEKERIVLPEYRGEIWHGYVPEIGPGSFYGYRVHGPYAPDEGHRFNPNKLVLDPYALVFYVWGVKREYPMAELKSYGALKDRMLKRPAVQRVFADEGVKL